MTMLVRLDGVELARGTKQVLTGIDLELQAGQVTTLVGPNGAGKSSLAHLVLGLLEPGRGHITRAPGLTVGYMPQKAGVPALLPMTACRFVQLAPGVERKAALAALAETGAADLANAPVQGLSGGEFQRVLLARAMVRRPQLLVLDEPAQGVDVEGQDALYGLVGAIRDRTGCGVLLVSHDLHLVMAESDQVLCLNRHLCCKGSPEAVSTHPEFVALFGAGHAPAPASHLAVYTHHHDHAHGLDGHVHGPDCAGKH